MLVDRGLVTQKQLTLILERSDKRPRLGEVLLRNGSITQERLEQALAGAAARRSGRSGEVLVSMGLLTDEAMRQALGLQLNVAVRGPRPGDARSGAGAGDQPELRPAALARADQLQSAPC